MTDPTLALLLDRFARRVHICLQSKAGTFDRYRVGPGGGMILMLLEETGPIPMQDLAARMIRDKSQMTRAVGPMERKGLIRRSPGARDARQSIVSLTDEGRAFVAILHGAVAACIDDVLAPVPADQQETLKRLLTAALGPDA